MFDKYHNPNEGSKVEGLEVALDSEIVATLEEKFKDNLDEFNDAEVNLKSYFRDLELRDDLLQNKTILDLGAGQHFFDEYCRRKYGAEVVAVDLSEDMLGGRHPSGVVADARSLPFKDESFDLIISHASMPHVLVPQTDDSGKFIKLEGDVRGETLKDILDLFRESYRTLSKGGQIRMSTFSELEELIHWDNRLENNFEPIVTERSKQHLERIFLVQEALALFEEETGARCVLKEREGGALITIKK